jgi:hypothetical protein
MQPGEALDVAAQVAVTLAGFAGIAVVFRPQSLHQWSEVDKFRLRLLLSNSTMPLVWSLFGILLFTVDPPLSWVWRWCSAFGIVTMVPYIAYNSRSGSRILRTHQVAISRVLYYAIALTGSVAFLLQLANLVWNRFWPFFFAIFFYLVAAIVQFMRLLLLPPHQQGGSPSE